MVSLLHLTFIFFICLGSLSYGYSSSIIGTTLSQPSFLAYFHLDTARNATNLTGAINGLLQAGSMFGALSVLALPDRLGRRWALFVGGVFCVAGGALQAGSVHMAMFLVGRFLGGFGIGSLVTVTPLYQSEVAPARLRGLLVGMHGVMICVGYALASWVGLGFYFVQGTLDQWRGPLAVQVLFPLLLCLFVFLVPESPRWLLTKDRYEDAHASYRRINIDEKNAESVVAVEDEFLLLRAQVAQEMKNPVRLSAFWTQKSLRRRCIIGWLVFAGGQGTATLVINNYGNILYTNLGFGPVQRLLIQCGWVSVCPLANLTNSLLIDRLGRIRLLLFGLAGTTVALIGECITVDAFVRTGSRGAASAAVFFLFLHILLFGVSYDATSYVYGSEIFPNPVRARGMGISITGLFAATIVFLESAPTAFEHIGWRYYTVFIACNTVMMVLIWFFFPETKGKSLEDVAEVFGDNIALDDANLESIHKAFQASHYSDRKLVQLMDGKAEAQVEEDEGGGLS